MTAVLLRDVWFSYRTVPVLEGVSVAIEPGERVALLGRNGVGKTTLTKLVVALLHPKRGAVQVAGRDTKGLAPEDLADVAAYLFQRPEQQLFARTLLDEVAFGPLRLGVARAEATGRAREALERVGLGDLETEHPYDLSPVHRRLVAFAAVLAQRPRVLVLDEPTRGFDRLGLRHLSSIMGALASAGVAILAVTHDMGLVAESFERAVVLDDGGVAFDGSSRDLILDAGRLARLGLEAPPAVRLSRALDLAEGPVTMAAVARAVQARRDSPAPGSSSRAAPM